MSSIELEYTCLIASCFTTSTRRHEELDAIEDYKCPGCKNETPGEELKRLVIPRIGLGQKEHGLRDVGEGKPYLRVPYQEDEFKMPQNPYLGVEVL